MREEEEEEGEEEREEEEDQIACEGPHTFVTETLLLIFCYDFLICDNFVCPDESE